MPPTAYKNPEEARADIVAALPPGKEMSVLDWSRINETAQSVPTTMPASSFSSVAGLNDLNKAKEKAAKLSATPTGPTPVYDKDNNITGYNTIDMGGRTTYQPNKVPESKVTETAKNVTTMVNAATGQEYTITDATPDQIQNFRDSGWEIAEGTGTGAGVVPEKTDPKLKALEESTSKAKADRDAAVAKLTAFNVSDDPALTSLLSSITSQWDARIKEMEKVNKSREGNVTTLGIRLGDRYTGGKGGMFGGIITEEESQGVQRIADLESKKQQALAAAKTAYSDQQWDRYAKLVDVADKAYKEQTDALTKLQESTEKEAKKIEEQKIQSSRDEAIARLYDQGITDATDLLDFLNRDESGKKVGDFTLDEVSKALKILVPDEKLTGASTDYKTFKLMQSTGEIPKDWSLFDYQRAVGNASRKAEEDTANTFKFSQTQQSQMLSGGFTTADIANLQSDISTSGLDAVLKNPSLTEEQKNLIRRSLAGSDTVSDITNDKFITTDYLSGLFSETALKKAASDDGYRTMLSSWETEKQNYLTDLYDRVEQYRKAGYSDQEILKMMQ